jgi:hypothetical protein
MSDEPKNIILLYSKFSVQCQDVLRILDEDERIHCICIDNKEIRSIVTRFIQQVPVILFVYEDKIEPFDGPDVVQWVKDFKNPPVPVPVPTPTPTPVELSVVDNSFLNTSVKSKARGAKDIAADFEMERQMMDDAVLQPGRRM